MTSVIHEHFDVAFFDVVVAGGGPAGSVTALCLARKGVRVALFEATNYDGERFGETLPPEINPVLRELGLWESFQALEPVQSPGIVSAWGSPSPGEQDFLSNAHGCGWHVDRNRFDAMLCREAEKAGATVFLNRTWRVGETSSGHLVDATGRAGLRLDEEHAYEKDDMLVAIALRLSHAGHADLRTVIETTPEGWWYTAPIPGDQAISMFFTDPDFYAAEGIVIGEQLERAPLTAARLESSHILSSKVVHAPSARRRKIFGEGWVTVGDSASAYDPLSGRGIFQALRHGPAAADAIVHGEMDAYAARVRREFDEYVRQRRMYYAGEKRWPESIFWRNRTRTITRT